MADGRRDVGEDAHLIGERPVFSDVSPVDGGRIGRKLVGRNIANAGQFFSLPRNAFGSYQLSDRILHGIPADSKGGRMQNRNRRRATTMRLVGALIGEVIDAHEGEAAFGTVEGLRRGFVALRKAGAASAREVARTARAVERASPETAGIVARAFAAYFAVVNIADEALLADERRDTANPRGLEATVEAIRASGVDFATFCERVGSLKLMPVFTAHPTEARRQAVQKCHRRLFELVSALVAADEDSAARAAALDDLRAEMSVLWKTSTLRTGKLSVDDEIDNGLRFFRASLFDAVPQTLREFEAAVRRAYGPAARDFRAPPAIAFGSWIGGDRDGNPNVTAATTLRAARAHAAEIREAYMQRIDALIGTLTHAAA
ncbi:MAG: phosphoenolpyruvate carboxylase, partial [Rhodospirillales bacterium]|nr:phosphoenolpyruvate carboxylase [Rhodospirillales bacterium]